MKNRLILGGILSSIVIITIIIHEKKANKEFIEHAKWMKENYPNLLIKDSLDTKVSSIYKYESVYVAYSENPNIISVSCSNEKKMSILTDKCLTSCEADIDLTVKTGSQLLKLPGSDTLTVKTNNKEYKFIIKEHY